MLAPGYGSASPTSDPTATIGVGHSAKSFRAAATSLLIVGSGGPAGNDPAATTSSLHFAVICGPERYRPRSRTTPVAGPASTIAALPSCWASSRLRMRIALSAVLRRPLIGLL